MMAFDRVWQNLNLFLRTRLMSIQYTAFWCFSMLYECTVQDATLPNRSFHDACVLCSWDPQDPHAKTILYVCMYVAEPIRINPELKMECKLISHTSNVIDVLEDSVRNHDSSTVLKDQSDCVLNDLGELGGTDFSWRISTILKTFLVSSSSCHAALALFVRPMMTKHKMTLKITLILQNSIAPSLSRGRLPWRRRLISFFDTE